jgi:hypothetical protein
MVLRSLQLHEHRINSNPPQVFNCGNPTEFPVASCVPDVILSITVCSSSSKSSLIFFKPRPALNKICFSDADGVLHAAESAMQKNVGVHGCLFSALLLALPPVALLAAARV